MISEILSVLQGLLWLFLIFLFLRLFYFSFPGFYKKTKAYLGTMIEESEDYWRYRWKKMHRVEKVNYEKLDNYNPERGWTLKPNLKNKLHYAAVVNSDSNGARISGSRKSGENVLFLGDSFCFGEGVDDNETIPAFFQENFQKVQAINLGVHGYGIDQQYLYMKEVLPRYKPSAICFVICSNDFRRNFMNFRDYAMPKFVLKNKEIILKNSPVPKPEHYLKMKTASLPFLFWELIRNFLVYHGFIKKKERIKISNYLMDHIKELAEKSNSKLYFIFIRDLQKGFFYKNYIPDYFINYFKKNKIKYLDVEKEFGRKKFEEMFDTLSGHLSAHGNEITAEKLAEIVKSDGELK